MSIELHPRVRQEVRPAHVPAQPQQRPRRVLIKWDNSLSSIHVWRKKSGPMVARISNASRSDPSLFEDIVLESPVEVGVKGDAAVAAADAVVEAQPHRLPNVVRDRLKVLPHLVQSDKLSRRFNMSKRIDTSSINHFVAL